MCGPLWYRIIRNSMKIFCNLSCREKPLSGSRTVIHFTLIKAFFKMKFPYFPLTITEGAWVLMTDLSEGLHAKWPKRSDLVRLGTVDRESEDTPTTLMSRRFMSCWSAERKPWLILGKTIWAGVWGQEVVGQRWEKVEEGWSPRGGRRRRRRKANAKRNRFC